jgi:putative two-component system response regulator
MERKKILIVDDTEFNRDLVVQLLEEDYDLVSAENGKRRDGSKRMMH